MKINGTWYNVGAISQITFEEFRSTLPNKTNEFCESIYIQVTGKEIPKTIEKKKIKKEVDEIKE